MRLRDYGSRPLAFPSKVLSTNHGGSIPTYSGYIPLSLYIYIYISRIKLIKDLLIS